MSSNTTSEHLPPKRTKPMTNPDAELPFAKTRLTSVVYFLSAGALLLLAFYSYRLTQAKARSGGWWNLALGRHPNAPLGSGGFSSGAAGGVESRIKDLADILGIPPREIALAIKPLLTSKNADSLASASDGDAAILGVLESREQAAPAAGGGGLGLDSLVGTDEPPN
ncbi:hypothetical protein BOTBODRAFT_43021 [Botryobasidium botryosum FD-172 SS1]|uniref:Uncharacterized protein n=1 Tax=Botryobasidium botryosum (strain FD-172 SS1) TaxID=930990 RepID=A0A067MRS1_BOTB1|nr:hypothetical protein BOTBODRAFT_43021 [Botryobasidium botryosum FD-172 SS1]